MDVIGKVVGHRRDICVFGFSNLLTFLVYIIIGV